ncbi:MAG: D-alanine--D-alanine ligase, partial [Oscillibacter sp.]|nr:D-alanine--D-alanine ligase [Oscillibacter sp.]
CGVIKCTTGGSSLGVFLPENREELEEALVKVRRFGGQVIWEERIYGRELTAAVLGDRALPAVETIPAGKDFDYAAKYQRGGAAEICPANLTEAEAAAAGELALRAHRALGLQVYSRTDMILDRDGKLWCLEVNSLPGMTPTSFVPQEAAAVGIGYGELCEEIVRLSLDVKRR